MSQNRPARASNRQGAIAAIVRVVRQTPAQLPRWRAGFYVAPINSAI
ncbi:MAG: hypothetical protein HC795_06580 [Coleofasciculaceae cyanobacterium RL_1_1]|nr:hypothetical protein [Coleofasciculaceae cyanobacterium RL_1_1]